MNVQHSRRSIQRGRSHRFAMGLLATAGMAGVLFAALYLSTPHAHTGTLDRHASAASPSAGSQVLGSGTGTSNVDAAVGAGSATFHEDADLRHLQPEPDPAPAAVAAY